MSGPTQVYRLYDAAGCLLYVGRTIRGERRLREHLRSQPWRSQIASTRWLVLATGEDARIHERAAIAQERPLYNKHFSLNPKPQTTPPVDLTPRFIKGDLSSTGVGKAMGIDRHQARRRLASGVIAGAYQVGARWFVSRAALERHIAGPEGDLGTRIDRLEVQVRLLLEVGRAQHEAALARLNERGR